MFAPDVFESRNVRKHDRFQFEVKLNHEFRENRPHEQYRVETFFFLPNNLDINSHTYTKADFYRDRLLYLRFRTPRFSLVSLSDSENRRSPLNRIDEKLRVLEHSPTREAADSLEYEIKLLGCVLKSTFRDHLALVYRSFFQCTAEGNSGAAATDCQAFLTTFVSRTREILEVYRGFAERIANASKGSLHLRSAFLFTDEYISLLFEWRCLNLLKWIASFPHLEHLAPDVAGLENLVQEESAYRKERYPQSMISKVGDNELFLFRFSVLKKYVAGVLYLNVRLVEEGKGLQEMALALSAGIAMLFATAIAFYYQRIYGTLSLSFFTALVVSYMFKDRIKALLQGYLQRALSRTLFDQALQIFHSFKGERIGRCREAVAFVDEERLDPRVLKLRDRDHLTEIENDWRREKILRYVRDITIHTTRPWSGSSRKNGLTDIFRFNIRNLLEKMNEADATLLYLKDGRVESLEARRVYHVNLVLKIVHGSLIQYERIRLVLTQEGIKRLEPVAIEEITDAK